MDLKTVLDRLCIPEHEPVFSADWDLTQTQLPQGRIHFLTPAYVQWACESAWLPDELTQTILAAARRVAADEALSALAWHCHYVLFRIPWKRPESHRWPLLTAALGPEDGMFYAIVLLSGMAEMQAVHQIHRIPPDIIRETVGDLKRCMRLEDYAQEFGRPGLNARFLGWLLNHWRGDLYKLGRLQFIPGPFRARLRVFRHNTRRTVIALSEEGVRYRADGQLDGAGGATDTSGAWMSALRITDKEIVGFPISPDGRAIHEEVCLPRSEWRQALAPGDPVLDMHIPTGGPMDYDQCGESLRSALAFFPRHFPDRPFLAFTCYSWILDAQFEQLLPPSSNLVRFQKELYLFPLSGSHTGTLRMVFGLNYQDPGKRPCKTTMQRAFARHVAEGGHFRGGGCFLLAEDLDWGSQCYRYRNYFTKNS